MNVNAVPGSTTADQAQQEEIVIRVRNLSRHFASEGERVDVLRDLNMDVARGAILSVEGASGAGKSTLLHLLGAIDHPSSGKLEVFGHDLTEMSRAEIERFRSTTVGFIFQHHYLLPDFTVLENVMMPLWILRGSVPEMRAEAIAMLERVGLGNRLNHYPSQISGGEMARAGVARALVGGKPLILADEPTGNLDRTNSEKLADLLWELQSEIGFNLIIVTHDMELARRVPHRYTLRNGKLECTT